LLQNLRQMARAKLRATGLKRLPHARFSSAFRSRAARSQ
jgi:hypothetical protein